LKNTPTEQQFRVFQRELPGYSFNRFTEFLEYHAGKAHVPAVGSKVIDFTGICDYPHSWLEEIMNSPYDRLSYGLHPGLATDKNIEQKIATMSEFISQYRDKICEIGETGLDWKPMMDPSRKSEILEKQKDLLRRHVKLAEAYELPLVLHDRWEGQQLLRTLEAWKVSQKLKIHLHCWVGSIAEASEWLQYFDDVLFSFSGKIVDIRAHPDAVTTLGMLDQMPYHRLAVETDAPYCGTRVADRIWPESIYRIWQGDMRSGSFKRGPGCSYPDMAVIPLMFYSWFTHKPVTDVARQFRENTLHFYGMS